MKELKSNKKAVIISVFTCFLIFTGLFLYTYSLSTSTLTEVPTQKSLLLHNFIKYEEDFGLVNSYNGLKKSKSSRESRTHKKELLMANLARSSQDLSQVLDQTKKNFPYTTDVVQILEELIENLEATLIANEYLQYWQVDLLKYQLMLVKLLNEKDAAVNAEIVDLIPKYQAKLREKSTEELCQILVGFGKHTSVKSIAEQIAAANLAGNQCQENAEVGGHHVR